MESILLLFNQSRFDSEKKLLWHRGNYMEIEFTENMNCHCSILLLNAKSFSIIKFGRDFIAHMFITIIVSRLPLMQLKVFCIVGPSSTILDFSSALLRASFYEAFPNSFLQGVARSSFTPSYHLGNTFHP